MRLHYFENFGFYGHDLHLELTSIRPLLKDRAKIPATVDILPNLHFPFFPVFPLIWVS